MHWGNPEILWLLALIPVLAWLGWRTLRWRDRAARSIGDPRVLARLFPPSVARWRRRRFLLLMAGSTLLILAAARPQYGKIEQNYKTYGTSAMVALDCSPSMRAHDMQPARGSDVPDRLKSAKDCLRMFLQRMKSNQVGIIAFAGTAFLQCPMTVDTNLALTILESIDFDSVSLAGTDIGKAIEVAIQSFENSGDEVSARTLILITDGEDNEGRAAEAARKAAAANVRIYAIGIGTERGAPIENYVTVPGNPGELPQKKSQGYIRNALGLAVNSRLQMGTLEQIASITGGKAYEAGNSPLQAVQSVVEDVYRQQKIEMESHKQVTYQDRFQWFLFPAMIALMLSAALMPERTRGAGATSAGRIEGRIERARA